MQLKAWLIAGVLIGGVAAAAGAAVLPADSWYHNRYTDKQLAEQAKGRLIPYDQLPLGGREAWIEIHGLQYKQQDKHGPSIKQVDALWANCNVAFPTLYREQRPNEQFNQRVQRYRFTYNSTRDPLAVGRDLHGLIEGNSELTKSGTRIVLLCHSLGGPVGQAYQYWSGGRKLVRALALGGSFEGTILADPSVARAAFRQLYPGVGGGALDLAKSRVDFNTPAMQWLRPNSPDSLKLHQLAPLDERWVLYGGLIEPKRTSLWQLYELVDALFFQHDSMAVSRYWSPLGAALIEAGGDQSGSDGLVSLSSAWAIGLTKGAALRRLDGYNHQEIIQGKGGEQELFRRILWDLVTFPPLPTPLSPPAIDFPMPSIDLFSVDATTVSDLAAARRAWISQDQAWVSADELSGNLVTPKAKQLQLGDGQFSWPSWLENDLVVTRRLSGQSNVLWVHSADGALQQLTDDGVSQLAAVSDDGNTIVFVSRNRLVVLSLSTQMARIVIDESLAITTPPVLWNNRIYFSHKIGQEYSTYWINASVSCGTLSKAKLVARSTWLPMKLHTPEGNLLVAVRSSGSRAELTVLVDDRLGVVRLAANGTFDQATEAFEWLRLEALEQLAFDSGSGFCYIVWGGQIRQLDTLYLTEQLPVWAAQAANQQPVEIDPARLLPVIATGAQLTVK
ncbi:MAG: hypothetical protein V1826_01355 [bacterium]